MSPCLSCIVPQIDYINKKTVGPFDIPKSSYIMAAIDRVVHHSVILDMMGVESYRAKEASQSQLHQQEYRQAVSNGSASEAESASFMRTSGRNH